MRYLFIALWVNVLFQLNLVYSMFHVLNDRNEIFMADQLTIFYIYCLDYTKCEPYVETLTQRKLKVKFSYQDN